jgi:hypothetical protein
VASLSSLSRQHPNPDPQIIQNQIVGMRSSTSLTDTAKALQKLILYKHFLIPKHGFCFLKSNSNLKAGHGYMG